MRVAVLGPVRVETDTGPVSITSAKERAVLSVLALRPGKAVAVGDMVAALLRTHRISRFAISESRG